MSTLPRLRRLCKAVRPVVDRFLNSGSAVHRRGPGRASLAEPLEARQLLTAVVVEGTAGDDAFLLRMHPDADDYPKTVQLFNNATGEGTPLHQVALGRLESIHINGHGGDDRLIVDVADGAPFPGGRLTFDGGSQGVGGDVLEVRGCDWGKGSYRPGLDGTAAFIAWRKTMNLVGLESITTSGFRALEVLTAGGEDVISLDAPAANQGRVSGSSDGAAFAPIAFTDIDNLIVDVAYSESSGAGDDAISIGGGGVGSAGQWVWLRAGFGANALAVNGGTVNLVASVAAAGQGFVIANVNGSAIVDLPRIQYLAELHINDSAQVRLPGNAYKVLLLDQLSLSATARLDLADNDLIVHGGDVSAITALIQSAYANGSWSGNGITSSTASPSCHTSLGVMASPGSFNQTLYSSWLGESLVAADVLVKFSYAGDANLDGVVNIGDYNQIDYGYIAHLTGWYNGNFNYDSVVNVDDYFIIDGAYIGQGLPRPQFFLAGAATIDEGAEYALTLDAGRIREEWWEGMWEGSWWEGWYETGEQYDPVSSWTVYWGDGEASTLTPTGQTAIQNLEPGVRLVCDRVEATHAYADEGQYTIMVAARGEDLNRWAGNVTVEVANVEPELSINGPSVIDEGQEYELLLSWIDPGDDGGTWSIDWGDGTVQSVDRDVEVAYHIYTDGPADVVISAAGVDDDGVYAAQPIAVHVNNVAPATPGNVTAVKVSDEEVKITWATPPAGLVDGFYILVSTDGVAYQEFDYVPGSQDEYHFFTSTEDDYSFGVESGDGGESSPPVFVENTIHVAASVVPPPTGFEVSGTAFIDHVHLVWQAGYQVAGYVIEWSDDGYEWFAIDEVGQAEYTDEYPALGDQHYRVVAYRGNLAPVYSEPSAAVEVHPIAPPVAWGDDNAGPNERGTLSPYVTRHDTPLQIDVLGNDIDYDYGSITIADYTQPANGTVVIDEYGNFTYTPNAGFVGTDSFTYVIDDGSMSDGSADSAPATVAIDVTNARPVAQRQVLAFDRSNFDVVDGLLVYHHRHEGILDADDADYDDVTFRIIDGPTAGTVTLDELSGQFTYEPGPGFSGYDSFTFVANDGVEDGIPASVVIESHTVLVAPNMNHYAMQPGYVHAWDQSDWAFIPYMRTLPDISGGTLSKESRESLVAPKAGYDTYYDVYTFVSGGTDGLFKIVLSDGVFDYKPQSFVFHEGVYPEPLGNWSAYYSGGIVRTFTVSPTEPSIFRAADTRFRWPEWTGSLSIGQQAAHGTVALDAEGGFTYTPADPDAPYRGWDFFSFIPRESNGHEQEQWIQLFVGLDYAPPPPIVTAYDDSPAPTPSAGEPASEWTPVSFDGTLPSLHSKLTIIEAKRNAVLRALEGLGGAWQPIASTTGDIDEVFDLADPVIAALDAAQSAYLTYLDGWLELNDNAAAYQNTYRAYLDNLWDGEMYSQVVMGVLELPRDIGGLQPNRDYLKKITKALEEFGDAAGFQSDLGGTVFTVAEIGEKLGYAASLATGGVSTGAQLLTRAGLTTLMKTVAMNYAVDKAAQWTLAPAMQGVVQWAVSMAARAGVNPICLQAGIMALQASGLIKGLKPRCVNGQCFAAGTQVVTGINADGSVVTRSIEDIRAGDYVMSRDQHDPLDELSPRRVTQVFRRTSEHLRTLSIKGDDGNIEVIGTTDEHPFYVDGRGWIGANELRIGDRLQETDGTWQVVLATGREEHPAGITVYNLEVQGAHTYFVSDNVGDTDAVWAHNYCLKATFFGRLKGRKPVGFKNAPATTQKLTKVTAAENQRVWDEFNGTGPYAGQTPKKEEFIKWLAQNKREELMASPANFSKTVLDEMAVTGKLPRDHHNFYQIHHKKPREFGGDNSFDNLMIMRKEPYHRALSDEIGIEAAGMNPGDVRDLTFPKFDGVVFYDPS